ncbi:MAG: purine-binding chemotaxis protein CheW [Elusimicrobia bacterium]|nr:purine-binding chemotaxis protein CheW [Elusimicrobiota bacterium]
MSQVAEETVLSGEVMQLVCFKLAQEEYAVDITNVQEVIKVQPITPVPQMPPFVLGVINIRGSIIPVFDMRKLFKLPEKAFDEQSKILVLKYEGVVVSIIVDQILDNIKIEHSSIDPAPEVRLKIERECIYGLGEIGDRMVIILNFNKVNGVAKREIQEYAKTL